MAKLRWQRNQGAFFDLPFTAEQVSQRWPQVVDFQNNNEYPTSMNDVFPKFNENLERIKNGQPADSKAKTSQPAQTKKVEQVPSNVQLKSEEIFSMMGSYIA